MTRRFDHEIGAVNCGCDWHPSCVGPVTHEINIPDSFEDELEREGYGGSCPSYDKPSVMAKLHQNSLYQIWVEGKEEQVRRHWWQFRRPATIDTSREAFDREIFEARMAELWP